MTRAFTKSKRNGFICTECIDGTDEIVVLISKAVEEIYSSFAVVDVDPHRLESRGELLDAVSELQDLFVTLHNSSVEFAANGELFEQSVALEDFAYSNPNVLGKTDIADVFLEQLVGE